MIHPPDLSAADAESQHALYRGDLSHGQMVPCSRYGRNASDCAWHALAAAYVLADANGDDPADPDIADSLMGLVVNDHPDVARLIADGWHAVPEYIRERVDTSILPAMDDLAHEPATGCWVDGHRGVYGIADVVSIATDYGYRLTAADVGMLAAYEAGEPDDSEGMCWLSDAAEAWMNEHVAQDGYAFGWHDGEFFYWSDEMWETDGYGYEDETDDPEPDDAPNPYAAPGGLLDEMRQAERLLD